VGHHGILPLGEYLSAARQGWGAAAYWRLPTLFWLDSSDTVLLAAAIIGVVLGLLVTVGIWVRPALIGAFVLYLSFVYAGQAFTNYQWDQLRSWLSGDLPHGWLAHSRMALPLAHLPFCVPRRCHEARLRGPDVVQPDRP